VITLIALEALSLVCPPRRYIGGMLLYLRFARIEASCSPMPRRRRPNRTHAESVAASVFVRRMGSMFLNYGNNASHYDDCFSLVVVSPVYQIPIVRG